MAIHRSARAWHATLACVVLAWPRALHAEQCAGKAACGESTGDDVVSLRDGSVACGTIVYRDEGRSLIIVNARKNRTILWADILCISSAPEPAPEAPRSPPPAQEAQTAPVVVPAASPEEPPARGLSLEWDVRVAGIGLWKHYAQQSEGAWSFGLGGGLGFGAAFHYEIDTSSGIDWYGFELGIAGTVAYASWNQVNTSGTSLIEQDISLRVGMRIAPWSGVVLGLAWLPTYVDFYGKHVAGPGTIHPAGVRLTIDIGDVDGPPVRVLMFRIALAFLPYIGRLPSMFGLSAGIVFY